MPSEYTPDDPLKSEEVLAFVKEALPDCPARSAERIGQGSTNLVYRIDCADGTKIIAKIAHRPDRRDAGILEKEARFLKELVDLESHGVHIPRILWEGKTSDGWPALIETHLSGLPMENLITPDISLENAGRQIGILVASLHTKRHHEVNEFEHGRQPMKTFPEYARYWLEQWRPLCEQATYVQPGHVHRAFEKVYAGLDDFDDMDWAYVHGDVSKENLLGELENGTLRITGLCDFENIQTGPAEYDIATIYNGLFLFHPEMQQPFFKGYTSILPLHSKFNQRFVTTNLFRALRYMKRTVKYNETHYFDHDREYLEAWIDK
jgi:Ser/Thr protein kinase RdoA (MazF antagonist)